MSDPRNKSKRTMYFPPEMLEAIEAEAARLDRSFSWVVQRAWMFAQEHVQSIPGAGDPALGEEDR